jgi:hypothetical protein
MKLHDEELHDLYISSNVIMFFKSGKIGWKRNAEPARDRAKMHGKNIVMKT